MQQSFETLPSPHWGIPGANGGGFTSFSLDLGSLVIGEYTFFHGFAINNSGTEKGFGGNFTRGSRLLLEDWV